MFNEALSAFADWMRHKVPLFALMLAAAAGLAIWLDVPTLAGFQEHRVWLWLVMFVGIVVAGTQVLDWIFTGVKMNIAHRAFLHRLAMLSPKDRCIVKQFINAKRQTMPWQVSYANLEALARNGFVRDQGNGYWAMSDHLWDYLCKHPDAVLTPDEEAERKKEKGV